MRRSVWGCRDRCGGKSCQSFTSDPADERGERYSHIGAGKRPGRSASPYSPQSMAVFLAGRKLSPGNQVEMRRAAIEVAARSDQVQ
jgi:hypothetical protein